MMNLSNLKKVSAFAFGIIAGFAIDKYANAENVSKLKAKASEAYEKLSNKLANATEPKVDYVQEGEVTVNLSSIFDNFDIRCKSAEDAKQLYEELSLHFELGHAETLAGLVEGGHLSADMITELGDSFTLDEAYICGVRPGKLVYNEGDTVVTVRYPDEIPEEEQADDGYSLKSRERYAQVKANESCTSVMDTYQKWCELEKARIGSNDILKFTTEELQELAPRTRRDVHAVLADLYEKLDDDYFVSVATLMQVIWDIENDNLRDDISFKDRFPLMTKNYDEDTLINYGWEDDDDAFCSDATPDSDFYVIIKQPPHNITSLVEEWTKENRKKFKEGTFIYEAY